MKSSEAPTTNIRWRSLALPTEHGGWSFILEPILLGLLLAPGWGGLALGIAALGAFLLRHPLRIYIKDIRSSRRAARTPAARSVALLYAALTLAAALAALWIAPSIDVLLPLLVAIPIFAVQLAQDFANRSRSPVAEISGALAAGALASSIVMMSGWALLPALALWLALAAKAVSAVVYVRARLRLERAQPAGVVRAVAVHLLACALLLAASAFALLPLTAPLAMGILTTRAALGLSRWRKPRPAKHIGIQEVIYGLLFVLLVAAG